MTIFVKGCHYPLIIYYSNLFQKYIIDYYENDSFPLNGWFKECILCYTVTGKYIEHNYNDKIIIIPMCNGCKNDNSVIKINFFIIFYLVLY